MKQTGIYTTDKWQDTKPGEPPHPADLDEYPFYEPDRCYNCGCYGRDLGNGEFHCENCDDYWNIYSDIPNIP